MTNSLVSEMNNFRENILSYLEFLHTNPFRLIMLIIDIVLVIFLAMKMIEILKDTRAWQLIKGIALLVIVTALSSILQLKILNYILTSIMTYGVIILIIVFQPELRRALEQLGTSKLSKFFGIDKDIRTRTKENIYKIAIAAVELSKTKTGALIVIERDIKVKDIIDSGILIDAEISPQLLVNIFKAKTPLHDGAVIISENKIMAAACMLPLSNDTHISKRLGTRHRSAIGMSKESDSIVIVVSEETGKISVAKDGTLIADVKEEALKQILIKNVITKRFGDENQEQEKSIFKIHIKEKKDKEKEVVKESSKKEDKKGKR